MTPGPSFLLPAAAAAFFAGFLKATFGRAAGTLPAMVLFWPTRLVFGIIGVQMEIFLTGLRMAPLTFAGLWPGKRVLEWAPQRESNLTILALSALTAMRPLMK